MLHFNSRFGKNEKSAREYRECASIHMEAMKSSMGTFFRTGAVLFAAVVAIVALARAWFANNTTVNGTGIAVTVNNEPSFYLATLKEDYHQGIYDDSGNNNLANALKTFQRIDDDATINNLPIFQVGTKEVEFGGKKYIVGTDDGISLMVNDTSDVNNADEGGFVGPGSKGEVSFYIIPIQKELNQVKLSLSLSAYKLVFENNKTVDAQLESNDTLRNILRGHILLFRAKDENGNYTGQITPILGENGNISYQFNVEDGLKKDQPVKITLYWIWPYRFEKIVYTGQSGSVFHDDEGSSYVDFLDWVNANRECIVYLQESHGISSLESASAGMSNAGLAEWSAGYNRGDQLIGDSVAYFVWTINAEN